jgi:hypothetical protein
VYRLSIDVDVFEAFGAMAFPALPAELPVMNVLASMAEYTIA